jgi:ferredoxin
MKDFRFLADEFYEPFLSNVIRDNELYAPVAQKNKFSYEKITDVSKVRLDFDVTTLPPKKFIFPPRQTLMTFKDGGKEYAPVLTAEPKIIFGIHFYDLKAIDMIDKLLNEPLADEHYLAQRHAVTLIGSNIQTINHRAFYSSVSKHLDPEGHDGFMTKIKGGYLYEVNSLKGLDLIRYGNFVVASQDQVDEAQRINREALLNCRRKLKYNEEEIARRMRQSFKMDALWERLTTGCFSCGACNLVCPTCYCFDVADEWSADQTSGIRYRRWDGCMLREFAVVSLSGGRLENFREKPGSRNKHRMMRKTCYLNEKLGGAACVGCGRCSLACVPDIADPVEIIHTVMEAVYEA